jgi:ATP-dependent RNA helicase DeaD
MRGSLDLDDLEILIFDEADRMMSMGFYPDMIAIRKYVPRERSSFMFSATFPANVKGLAREFLDEPVFLSLSHGNVSVSSMDHVFYEIAAMDKDRALTRIIELENPTSANIFCNTKQRVNYVTTVLQRFGYDADQLTADLTQRHREEVLDRIRAGNLRFLVATDVAARGIDIANLSHVFLYEFPEDHESYIHRAGRTGRAGAAGICVSLVTYMEVPEVERVGRQYGIEMERRTVPTDEDVAEIVSERITALLEQKLRDRDSLEKERMRRFVTLARHLSENEDELDILAMLLDDFYHGTLHAPAAPLASAERESRGLPPKRDERKGGGGRSSNKGPASGPGGGKSSSGRRRRSGGGGGGRSR